MKVQLRDGFSDRNKIKEENKQMQLLDFDKRTRVAFINTINAVFKYLDSHKSEDEIQRFIKNTYSQIYTMIIDEYAHYSENAFLKKIQDTIENDSYDSVLTVIEYLVNKLEDIAGEDLTTYFNDIFENDFVGYRFIDDKIVAITDEVEVKEIEEAIDKNPYSKVKSHIQKALNLLSDRDKKDYSNSIKESITAVECICQIIVGKQTTLSEALKKLEDNGLVLNPVFKIAIEKLYNWTNDENDARHANAFKEKTPTFEDAKFMLVTCSAFVNYLIAEYGKIQKKNK